MDHDAHDVWMRGGSLEGVAFAPRDPVVVLEGEAAGALGVVISLQSLAPEPLYAVELASGETVGALQSSLRPAV
jgi:hypothetical protein